MFDPNEVFLGIAPIGWCNDDMPELGAENGFRQIVSEMALAGFAGCEIGNKYPSDPVALRRELDLRGLRVASRWHSSFILSRPMEEVEAAFAADLDFLSALGATCVNVSEQTGSIQGKDAPILADARPVMDDGGWDRLCAGLDRLGELAAGRGIRLCYHHHMGTVVQTLEETERLLSGTRADRVSLCYDTGHFAFAGEDPLAILKGHAGRVGHVHLKDVRASVVVRARDEGWSFLQAVREGAFTVPGDGDLDFAPVFELLDAAKYKGWLLVEAEQDPARADPLEYALKARRYIRERTGL
ncbi:MAG: myo-inosose-2 dehydratase [Synergistaceae bacterium]|nr:myo-inosose-2 dehydratase [Synergistaceae bacterium]